MGALAWLLPALAAAAMLSPKPAGAFVPCCGASCSKRPTFVSHRRMTSTSSGSSSDPSTETDNNDAPRVVLALTREEGKNGKLDDALSAHPMVKMIPVSLDKMEIPCIEHAGGNDWDELISLLSEGRIKEFHYVVITSPEAAKVIVGAIQESSMSMDDFIAAEVEVAAVGKATEEALKDFGIEASFVPSQANGKTLAAELPAKDGVDVIKVLYPCSAKARNDIQDGLEERKEDDGAKFDFTRLNSYDTVPATFTDEQIDAIDEVDVACFGSPSSVEAWLKNIDRARGFEDLDEDAKKKLGPDGNGNVLAACIGTTSARACLESGRWHATDIYYPKEDPGVESWAQSAAQAMADTLERKFWA